MTNEYHILVIFTVILPHEVLFHITRHYCRYDMCIGFKIRMCSFNSVLKTALKRNVVIGQLFYGTYVPLPKIKSLYRLIDLCKMALKHSPGRLNSSTNLLVLVHLLSHKHQY